MDFSDEDINYIFENEFHVNFAELQPIIPNWDKKISKILSLFKNNSMTYYINITELFHDIYEKKIYVVENSTKYQWSIFIKDKWKPISKRCMSILIMKIACHFCNYHIASYRQLLDQGKHILSLEKSIEILEQLCIQFQGKSQGDYSRYKVMEIYESKYSN